jgi:alanyl-tRNA synthetase
MKPLSGTEIRQMWLDFFASKGHHIIPSASLVPYQDPTLLWINSGVAAIKHYFDGREIPTHRRLVNAQKSIRTNDIEQVGYTARHHTFFEMLGNFSIGDYFRKEAIQWAYELLFSPKWFAFEQEKLYFTYSPLDLETKQLWLQLGIQEDHLVPLEGNFWEIGEGPCGPDTEIFYDRGDRYDPEHKGITLLQEEVSNDRYIEIWNIVFSQFQSDPKVARYQYKELPNKNIDTGSGLERLACIMQGTETNFETDLFFPIIKATERLASVDYTSSGYRPYRVITDHIRTLTFALADGALFANEGRGYVLRRILRRALRYGRKIGIFQPFLHTLVTEVIQIMEQFYPYLLEHKVRIEKTILAEENKFIHTLVQGESLLKSMLEGVTVLSGDKAFKLYDTYGFPIELTQEIAAEQHIEVDFVGFETMMQKQKELAREARQQVEGGFKQSKDLLAFTMPSTYVEDVSVMEAKVIGLFKHGEQVDHLDDEGDVMFERTNFYAESGGQIYDTGYIEHPSMRSEVHHVIKAPHKQPLHHVQVVYGEIRLNDVCTLHIHTSRRQKITSNHSAVHLLQASLKSHLGAHILQQGSFVGDEYARFDFTHGEKITETELMLIEKDVNEMIANATPTVIEIMPIAEAKLSGATSPFNEKYSDWVRVVTLNGRSKEFCGGSHVKNTQEIGMMTIASEESIASGTRRLTILTGLKAYERMKQKEQTLSMIRDMMKASSHGEIIDRLKASISEQQHTKQALQESIRQQALMMSSSLLSTVVNTPIPHLFSYQPLMDKALMMQVIDALKSTNPELLIVIIGKENHQYPIVTYVGPSLLSQGFHAGQLMKKVSTLLLGSGGGKPDLAYGAGKSIDALAQVWDSILL